MRMTNPGSGDRLRGAGPLRREAPAVHRHPHHLRHRLRGDLGLGAQRPGTARQDQRQGGDACSPTGRSSTPISCVTLPGRLVAWTGADALTHAVEATTCRLANPVSDALAEKAVALLLRYLRRAAADIAGDAEAREAVMRASTLAGLAFGNADVAAVHCLSETLGGRCDLPHGLANAVLLAPVTRYNLEACADKLATLEAALPPGSGTGRRRGPPGDRGPGAGPRHPPVPATSSIPADGLSMDRRAGGAERLERVESAGDGGRRSTWNC